MTVAKAILATVPESLRASEATRANSMALIARARRLITESCDLLQRCPRRIAGGGYAADDGDELRERVRRSLSTGALHPAAEKSWAGYGTGRPCTVCLKTITAQEVEYEVDGAANGEPARAHLSCYLIWRQESEGQRSSSTSPEPGS
jgi:hypothetical protein